MQVELQPAADVPARAALLRLLSDADAPGCFGKIENVPRLVAFMLWPAYRGSLLEGAVASVGGISASLSERVTGALVCLLCQPAYMAAHAIAGKAELQGALRMLGMSAPELPSHMLAPFRTASGALSHDRPTRHFKLRCRATNPDSLPCAP